jgi:hypothetical protein
MGSRDGIASDGERQRTWRLGNAPRPCSEGHPPARVITHGLTEADAWELASALGTEGFRRYRFLPRIAACVADKQVGAVVLGTESSEQEVHEVLHQLRTLADPPLLVVRRTLHSHRDSTLQLIRESEAVETRLSIVGFDDLGYDLNWIQQDNPKGPRRRILASILPEIPADLRGPAAALLICGERRSSVREAAMLCGCSPRRLQERLAAARLPQAHRFLNSSLVLHLVWSAQRTTWSPKVAAARRGWPSADALARRVQRELGHGFCDGRPRNVFRGRAVVRDHSTTR